MSKVKKLLLKKLGKDESKHVIYSTWKWLGFYNESCTICTLQVRNAYEIGNSQKQRY